MSRFFGGGRGIHSLAIWFCQWILNMILNFLQGGSLNKVLFVENLPDWCTNFALQQLFSQAEGLVDIRAILFKKVAFVEYASEALATKALNSQTKPSFYFIPSLRSAALPLHSPTQPVHFSLAHSLRLTAPLLVLATGTSSCTIVFVDPCHPSLKFPFVIATWLDYHWYYYFNLYMLSVLTDLSIGRFAPEASCGVSAPPDVAWIGQFLFIDTSPSFVYSIH